MGAYQGSFRIIQARFLLAWGLCAALLLPFPLPGFSPNARCKTPRSALLAYCKTPRNPWAFPDPDSWVEVLGSGGLPRKSPGFYFRNRKRVPLGSSNWVLVNPVLLYGYSEFVSTRPPNRTHAESFLSPQNYPPRQLAVKKNNDPKKSEHTPLIRPNQT